MSGPFQNLGVGMTTSAGLVQVLSSVQSVGEPPRFVSGHERAGWIGL